MNYQETCDYLFHQIANYEQQGQSGYKEGLYNTEALDAHFGHPHRAYATIHVAGTNGKGSVAHLLAAALQAHGLRTGLYTSPHINDFSERIRVDGQPIDHQYVVDFVARERSFFEPLQPSFFELATTMAFKYFKDRQVDVAVVEVGLGGRLDCTNIIRPVLSVITNISLEHTQMLGNTLALIAREKGGIIKSGVPVVIGESVEETRSVFCQLAFANQVPIRFAEDAPEVVEAAPLPTGGMHYRTRHYGPLDCELGGLFQAKNMNTVLCALRTLEQTQTFGTLKTELLQRAFTRVGATTGLMCRWQTLQTRPTVICDCGHNPAAWRNICRQLESTPCRYRHIVIGMAADKDVETVVAMLPADATYYYTKAQSHRALDEHQLEAIGLQRGLKGTCYPSVGQAAAQAMKNASADDLVFIGGSFYVVGDYLKNRI